MQNEYLLLKIDFQLRNFVLNDFWKQKMYFLTLDQSRKRASTPVLRLYVRPQINPQINEKVAIFLEFTNSSGHSAWPQKALDSFGSPITPL